MSKAVHFLVVKVEVPKKFGRKRLCKVLDRLIQIGLEDAVDSTDSDDEDLDVVEAMKITSPQ